VLGIGIIAVGVLVAWLSNRTIFRFTAEDPRIRSYLSGATGIAAFALLFAILRLLFSPSGYFSTVTGVNADGTPDTFLFGWNLSGLALSDPLGLVGALVVAVIVGAGAFAWARRGENARFFPVWIGGFTTGLVAAAISAPSRHCSGRDRAAPAPSLPSAASSARTPSSPPSPRASPATRSTRRSRTRSSSSSSERSR
jgi:hypothetical protein